MTARPIKSRLATMVEEAEKEAPPAPPSVDEESDDMFDLSEQEAIRECKKYSALTRIAAYYNKYTQKEFPFLHSDITSLEVKDFKNVCAMFGTLGLSNWVDGVMGTFDRSEYDRLRQLPPGVIRATIVGMRKASIESYTNYTLGAKIAALAGTTVRMTKEGAEYSVSGYPGTICVSTENPTRGVVTKGAREYLTWQQELSGRGWEYYEVSQDLRIVARYIATKLDFKIQDFKLILVPRPSYDDKKLKLAFPEAPLMLSKYLEIMKLELQDFFNEKTHPPVGIKADKAPIELASWLLASNWDTFSTVPENVEYFTRFVKAIRSHGERVIGRAAELAAPLTPINVIEGKNCSLPGVQFKLSYHRAFEYVDLHRKAGRGLPSIDLPRKSDSTAIGSVAGEITSVPDKIKRAWGATGSKPGQYPVHAFGVAENNWMRKEVEKIAKAQPVTWYDINGDYKVPGAKVEVRDIMTLRDNEGVGKLLIDDTFPSSYEAKLSAIMRAKYSAFVAKVYFGKMGEGNNELGTVIDIYDRLSINYHIGYSKGGGTHSPEGFVWGVLREKSHPSPDDDLIDLHDAINVHVAECLASNIYRTACVVSGYHGPDPSWVRNVGGSSNALDLNGAVGVDSRTIAPKPADPGVPKARVLKSRLVDGGPDPVVKSQLNGVNGEATNKDDVLMTYFPVGISVKIRWLLENADKSRLPREYPDDMRIGSVFLMGPVAYGKGRDIKFGGCTNFGECVKVCNGQFGNGVIYIFRSNDGKFHVRDDLASFVRLVVVLPQAEADDFFEECERAGALIDKVWHEMHSHA